MKIIAGIVLGFVLGFVAHAAFFRKPTNADHWRTVEKYNAYINDPGNFKPDAATGFAVASPPAEPLASLAALEASGELTHLDLVFPNIPYTRDSAQAWLKFCQSRKQIVYATGNPSYSSVQITGVQPLHLNLWFREADIAVVHHLIKELEKKNTK